VIVHSQRRQRRRLFLLLAPVAVLFTAGLIGIAFAPVLLAREPLVLIAMSPLLRHLVLASNSVDALPFVVVAVVRLFAPDPFLYVIGREYGPEAIDWVKARSRGAGRMMRFAERAFVRAGVLVLFISPGPLVCLLAGAARMPITTFLVVNVLGTAAVVLLVRSFGLAFAAKVELVRAFVAANIVGLTVVSLVLVLTSVAVKRRRFRARRTRQPSTT
jgi:membrane protein DedA with SNARE-associated domain